MQRSKKRSVRRRHKEDTDRKEEKMDEVDGKHEQIEEEVMRM